MGSCKTLRVPPNTGFASFFRGIKELTPIIQGTEGRVSSLLTLWLSSSSGLVFPALVPMLMLYPGTLMTAAQPYATTVRRGDVASLRTMPPWFGDHRKTAHGLNSATTLSRLFFGHTLRPYLHAQQQSAAVRYFPDELTGR